MKKPKKNWRSVNWLKENKFLIILLLLIVVFLYYGYTKEGIVHSLIYEDTGAISNFLNSFGIFSIVIFTILVIIEVVLAPIPSVILYAVGGIIFGTFLGGSAALVGNIIGAVIAYKIAKAYGRKYVEQKADKKKLARFDKFSRKYGSYAIFLLRVNPLTSSDVFSYLAGLSKISLKQLIWGTALGLLPLVYIQSYIGDSFIKNNPILYFIFIVISVLYVVLLFYGAYNLKSKKVVKKQKF